ncbi:carbon-nitrogen family hydrolase [Haloarcula sp. S1CR25-12]|uniref:Carbon-nitrogen family hydrolase n=1 Tax=Haloarcula saliterrae TaxID=2950534 RepID=A0ABU2F9X6_9EURY|nr:carbon-nitrogen family hydrolase [Haloarcula sp. S1CR25-12]MDS0258997.1 carbon-nitrogen family hydrolase [Haloarcula sp. S1CR25-12]
MKLALAQMAVEPADLSGNRRRAVDAVERAAADGCELVVLPELFTVGYFAFEAYARSAEGIGGETLTELQSLAAEHDIAVLAGSFVEDLELSAADGHDVPAPEGLANTSVFIDRAGERRAVYRKQHLFGYDSAESELLVAGDSVPTVDFAGFTVGVTTCYDLRFPELYRRLVDDGVTLVLVPSAWPYPRVEHWRLLPRARAVENQCYVAAANGVGRFEEAELLGRSTVYDPWGTTLASADDDAALVTATVTPEKVSAVRSEFPALADRRGDLG